MILREREGEKEETTTTTYGRCAMCDDDGVDSEFKGEGEGERGQAMGSGCNHPQHKRSVAAFFRR